MTEQFRYCAHCGHEFAIQPEPAAEWLRGCVRPLTKLSTLEMQAFRALEGMPLSHYLCGRCYYDVVLPLSEFRKRRIEDARKESHGH